MVIIIDGATFFLHFLRQVPSYGLRPTSGGWRGMGRGTVGDSSPPTKLLATPLKLFYVQLLSDHLAIFSFH